MGSVWTCYEYLTELSRSKQHVGKICYTGVYSETIPNYIDRRWAEAKLFKLAQQGTNFGFHCKQVFDQTQYM